jgi:hypothetical protein
MSTTNLISKSLSGALLQNGNGVPDHVGTIGSLYFDSTSSHLYKYARAYSGTTNSNSAIWDEIPESSSVNITSTLSSGTVVTADVGTWYSLSGSTWGWGTNSANNFGVESGRVRYTGSTTGKFFINAAVTLKYNANLANYRMGISFNGVAPMDGSYASGTLHDATSLYQTINAFGIYALISGDTVELCFNSPNVASTTTSMSGMSLSIKQIE